MSRHIPLICIGLALGALSARAEKARLVVFPFASGEGASETASTKFYGLVVEDLKSRGELLEVVPPVVKTAPVAPPVVNRGQSLEAVAALNAGKKAFDELRFEDAVGNLRKGVDGLLADPSTVEFDSITDAYVKLAASAFRLGEEKDAKSALLELARLAPNYMLPPGYPPVFQREFEKAKKRLEKQPKGSLSIEGPSGATGFIDGRDLGMLPVEENNLAGGLHYVKVEGTKGERFGQVVNVVGSVKVKASFGSAERTPVITAKPAVAELSLGAQVDEATVNRLVASLKALNADWALLGYVSKASDTQLTAGMALFSAKKNGFVTLSPVTFDADVLTANTEAFKLGGEVSKRLGTFGTAVNVPFALAVRAPRAIDPDNLETAGPSAKKVVLVPRDTTDPAVDLAVRPEEAKAAPKWGWIGVGIGVGVALVGTGLAFGIMGATNSGPFKPVTGTVTATW